MPFFDFGTLNVTIGLSATLETWLQNQSSNTSAQLTRIEANQHAALAQGATIMSQISDFAATVNGNFASIKTGIQALDDKITAFQNSPGTLSPSDQAALDDIVATSATLAAAANAAVPPAPAA